MDVSSQAEHELAVQAAVDEAIHRVQATSHDEQREFVIQFENELAQFCDSSFAVATRSARLAMLATCAAIDFVRGDEIIVSPFIGSSIAQAIEETAATTKIVDCDESGGASFESLSSAISQKTTAIIVTHQFGIPTNLEPIADLCREHGIVLIEEVGTSFGGKISGQGVGSFGDVAICSFFPTQPLAALADGGAVLTQSGDIAETARKFVSDYARSHPLSMGTNDERLAPIQAAVLCARLDLYDEGRAIRNARAHLYETSLPVIYAPVVVGESIEPSYAHFPVKVSERDSLFNSLAEAQIPFENDLAVETFAREPELNFEVVGELSNAKSLSDSIVGLPISGVIQDVEVLHAIELCKNRARDLEVLRKAH